MANDIDNRDRIISLIWSRFSVLRIVALLAVGGMPGAASAAATLTLPPDSEAGIVLDADEASLLSILDELATRTGMVIKGRQHISDRPISGKYEGYLPDVLEAQEHFLVPVEAAG